MPATRPRPCRHDRVAPARRLRAWLVVRLGLRPHPQLGACTLLAASCAASTWCCNALGSDCRITPPRTRASCHASASREVVSASSESSEAGWGLGASTIHDHVRPSLHARAASSPRCKKARTGVKHGPTRGRPRARSHCTASTNCSSRKTSLLAKCSQARARAQTQHVHSRPDIS